MPEFRVLLEQHAQLVEAQLNDLLGQTAGEYENHRPEHLLAAMRYSALDGGKRIRPFLLIESAKLFGVPPSGSVRAACALECIHCYSLVHDDLPAMDNKPCEQKFTPLPSCMNCLLAHQHTLFICMIYTLLIRKKQFLITFKY